MRYCLIPGTFSILHHGHLGIYYHIKDMAYNPVFGISESSYDKQGFPLEERVKQFEDYNIPYFIMKKRSIYGNVKDFANCFTNEKISVALGHDTFERFLDPKYSYGSKRLLRDVINEMRDITFLIFPRNGKLLVESDIFPHKYIYVSDYKEINISSTELRIKNV